MFINTPSSVLASITFFAPCNNWSTCLDEHQTTGLVKLSCAVTTKCPLYDYQQCVCAMVQLVYFRRRYHHRSSKHMVLQCSRGYHDQSAVAQVCTVLIGVDAPNRVSQLYWVLRSQLRLMLRSVRAVWVSGGGLWPLLGLASLAVYVLATGHGH